MEKEKDTQKEWEELGIETDWYARAVIRGWILPSCPWLNAAERMVTIVGRPAAELTKLFANQLDLFSLSPEEEAHKKFEEELVKGTGRYRLQHLEAMVSYMASPVVPLRLEVYRELLKLIDALEEARAQLWEGIRRIEAIFRGLMHQTVEARRDEEAAETYSYKRGAIEQKSPPPDKRGVKPYQQRQSPPIQAQFYQAVQQIQQAQMSFAWVEIQARSQALQLRREIYPP